MRRFPLLQAINDVSSSKEYPSGKKTLSASLLAVLLDITAAINRYVSDDNVHVRRPQAHQVEDLTTVSSSARPSASFWYSSQRLLQRRSCKSSVLCLAGRVVPLEKAFQKK